MPVQEELFTSNARLPCLDGWRALAIVMVLGSHCPYTVGFPSERKVVFEWLFDGFLGVRFFFVISGFLIAMLMLRENYQSGFSLRRFWLRRALRILPVYLTFLFALFLLQTFTDFRMSANQWWGALTFTWNYILEWQFLPNHLWSISVEEQFYVVWSVLFSVIGRNYKSLTALAAIAIVTPLGLQIVGLANTRRAFDMWSFLTNMDALAVGCCFAYFAYFRGHQIIRRQRLWPLATAGATMVIVPYVFSRLQLPWLSGEFTHKLYALLQAIGFGIVMLVSIVRSNHWMTFALRWWPVVWVGVLSYSLYIWQQLFCSPPSLFGVGDVWYLRFPTWILAAFMTAVVSYYCVERPFLRLKRLFES